MTEQITNIPDKGNKKRIVIVGGGFGGLKIARKLKRQHYQVVLLDKNNYHLFQPLLYQVATQASSPVLFHSHSARYSKDTKTFISAYVKYNKYILKNNKSPLPSAV